MGIERVADGLWTEARPLRFWGVETGARMTIVRLGDGRLFVHSPLPLAPVRQEVDALGEVAAVVAPSLFHHMSIPEWKEAYPDAGFACCPGLDDKRADIVWDHVLSDAPLPAWADDLEQVHFGARTLENEVVFFHPATRTMICADAIFNLRQHPDPLTRVVALALGNRGPGATWLERVMIRDRAAGREQIDRMLAWHAERILLAHGAPVERDAEAVVAKAYAWL